MPGQHCAGEVVEAPGAGLAAIALPSALRVVAPVPDNREAVTPRTTHAIGPAMLAHQGEALGVVQKSREVDPIGCSHDDGGSSRKPDGCLCSSYHTRCPAGTLSKPTTPEADKSHRDPLIRARSRLDQAEPGPARLHLALAGASGVQR